MRVREIILRVARENQICFCFAKSKQDFLFFRSKQVLFMFCVLFDKVVFVTIF